MKPDASPEDRKAEAQEQQGGANPPPTVPPSVVGSEAPALEHNPSPSGDENASAGRKKPKWQKVLPKWTVALCTIALVAVATLQYIVTDGQLREMRTQSAQTKAAFDFTIEQGHLDQRAWLGIRTVEIDPLEAGKPFRAEIIIANSGKTPARNVSVPGVIEITPAEIVSPERFLRETPEYKPTEEASSRAIFPGSEAGIEFVTKRLMTPELIAEIMSGKQKVYIIGTIRYEDVFREKHTTFYCQEYVPTVGKFGARRHHNDAN